MIFDRWKQISSQFLTKWKKMQYAFYRWLGYMRLAFAEDIQERAGKIVSLYPDMD